MRFKIVPYLFRCDGCNKEWKMDDAQINLSYWCPYCGTESLPIGLFGQETKSSRPKAEPTANFNEEPTPKPQAEQLMDNYAEDGHARFEEEAPIFNPERESYLGVNKSFPPSIMTKKKPTRLLAEDRMTEKMCKEGGWWNPIKKECQGEGNGHDVGGATWSEDME